MSQEFRFAKVLRLRECERDQVALQFAAAQDYLTDLSDRRQAVANERQALRRRRLAVRSGVISAATLKTHDDFDATLADRDALLAEQESAAQQRLESCHSFLVKAQQEVAKLEKLQALEQTNRRTRRQNQYLAEQDAMVASQFASAHVNAKP